MPEFRRSWKDWAPGETPTGTQYEADKTDKNPSVSFVRPIARPEPANRESSRHHRAEACQTEGCGSRGYIVDLGAGQATCLCARHRRELFRLAAELAEEHCTTTEDSVAGPVPCRLCGTIVSAAEDPCRPCLAQLSPLVQLALKLGARPLCPCGEPITVAGALCAACLVAGNET
jgi:hypothetical protein